MKQHFNMRGVSACPASAGLPKRYPALPILCEDKIAAIRDFIRTGEDIIIQVLRQGDRYISLDGHIRLYYAAAMAWTEIRAVEETSGDYIYGFVEEVIKRNIRSPYDYS